MHAVSCTFCREKGCDACSYAGWMEILGSGMHPQVLRNVGLDRAAMIKYDIPNIRTLFENDVRVLQQF